MKHGHHEGYTMTDYNEPKEPELDYIERETLYGQCQQFREACIDLGGQIAKILRFREFCVRVERFLRSFKKLTDGCESGQLACTYHVDNVSHHILSRYMGEVNASPMTLCGLQFQRGQLLLVSANITTPLFGEKRVELVFRVHSGKWSTRPKVMVPRWRGGYKFAEVKGSPILNHVDMQGLITYLQILQEQAKIPTINQQLKTGD